MKNFKEVAEKCLSGELKGTFKLRSGKLVSSDNLERRPVDPSLTYQYQLYLDGNPFLYTIRGTLFSFKIHSLDIIDFIPDNMQEQIKIDIPEGKVPVMEQTENGVVITWKEKELTYNDIESKLNCSISSCGFLPNKINFTFYKKVEVIRKLTNIRNYFGKSDKNKEGWIIEQGGIRKTMFESKYCVHTTVFAKREHAEQAIKILGDELKYLFEPW